MPSRLRPLLTEFLDLLQVHCAPMRDQEVVVEVAQPCVPGGVSTKADAVKAVRMCLDILELMKLDIVKVGAHLFNSRSSGSRLPINTCWLRKLFPILHYPHHPSAITLSAEHFVLALPSTTSLHSARLVTFSTDAADATAMYMFLMLYRQLVFFDTSPRRCSSSEMPRGDRVGSVAA